MDGLDYTQCAPRGSILFQQTDSLGYFNLNQENSCISPDPILQGSTETVTVSGEFTVPVEVAYVDASIVMFGVPIAFKRFRQQPEITEPQTAWQINLQINVPIGVPTGNDYTGVVSGRGKTSSDQTANELLF